MVGYGESLTRARRPGWESAYLDYSYLSLLLKDLEESYAKSMDQNSQIDVDEENPSETTGLLFEKSRDESVTIEKDQAPTHLTLEEMAHEASENFLRVLRKQVEKISLFTLSRQGDLADAVGYLRFDIGALNLGLKARTMDETDHNVAAFGEKLLIAHGSDSKLYGATAYQTEESFLASLDRITRSEPSDSYHSEESFESMAFPLPTCKRYLQGEKDKIDNSSLRLRDSLKYKPKPLFTGESVFNNKNPLEISTIGSGLEIEEERAATTTSSSTKSSTVLDPYTLIGVELLHILRFVCINAMGVRKILKKYDKILQTYVGSEGERYGLIREELDSYSPLMSSFHSDLGINGPDVHLQMLANSDSLSAITSSLIKASTKTGVFDESVEMNMIYDESILRFKCVIDCIDILREYANTVNEPFNAFLSRHALIVTGRDLGGIPSIKQRALEILLTFDPDTVLYMEKSDLTEWQQKCWNYTFTGTGSKMRTTSFDLMNEDRMGIKTTEASLAWGGSDSISMFLNFMSIFLYTVNYYIAAPTANRYAIYLNADGALGSTLIGASSAAAFFGAFIYSWWYTRFSFKSVLLFSSFCASVGNLLYALALSFNSMKIAIMGRLLVGLGSAEVVNRQMISSSVHFTHMTKASAKFVVYGAIGMSVGPLVAGILDTVAGRDITIDVILPFIGGVIVNHVTAPGFLMASAWIVQFISILILYSEPYRINSLHHDKGAEKNLGFCGDLRMVASLVMKNPAVPITLFLFSYIELVCEVLISSCAMICKRYFSWTGSTAGFLISSLGAFILPAHYIVERASRRFEERAIMKYALLFVTFCLLGILNFQTFIQDTILIGSDAWGVAKVDGANARNASISAFQMANSTLQHDWVVIRNPNTWDQLRNESHEEIEKLEKQTEDGWNNINEIGRKEWGDIKAVSEQKWHDLKDKSEKEWEDLSVLASEKWNDIENVSEEKWNQWSESISTEFDRLPNQTENAYHHMDNEARVEWNRFTNQTYRDWLKISKSVQKKWRQILRSVENEWSAVSKTAEDDWNNKYVDTNQKSNVTNEMVTDESNNTLSPSINETGLSKHKWHNASEISSHSLSKHETNITQNALNNSTKTSKHNIHNKVRNNSNFGGPTQEINATEKSKEKQHNNGDDSTELDWKTMSNSTQEALGHLIEATKHKWHNITKTTKRKWHDLIKSSNDTIREAKHHLKNISETGEMEWENITDKSGEKLNNIRDKSIIWWNDLRGGISSTINSTGQALTGAEDAAKKNLKKIQDDAPKRVEDLKENLSIAVTSVKNETGPALQTVQGDWNKLGEFVKDEWGEVSSPATVEKVKDTSSKLIQDAKNASSNGIEFLKEKVEDLINNISGDESRNSPHRMLVDNDEMIPYDWGWGYYAYMISVCAVFMGTIILEGVDTSIMCKSAPARLNSTFINVGLLATLIGTLGRVIGDGLITASAYIDRSRYTDFINNVYLPLIPITILGIYYIYKYYYTLV